MQGLITIDFGNSHPHAGLFQKHSDGWKLLKVTPWNELPIFLHQLGMNPENSGLVLCEVKMREVDIDALVDQGFYLTRVRNYWKGKRFAGMPVNYAHTLGEDRLIQAFYAYKKIQENTLLIDAGTFATMDVITRDGFMGGYIIPGIETYFSTFQKGEQLKAVGIDQNLSSALPQTTTEAMRDSYLAFAALAQKLIGEHKIQKVILTGGQGELWKTFFDGFTLGAVVQVEPTLIHLALHYWMTTQIEPL